MLNRSVAKRCVMAGLLVIPGALFAKHGTSIGLTLTSEILGCAVMVIASLPLALLTSSSIFTEMISWEKRMPTWQRLAFPVAFTGSGIVLGIVHGFSLVPASFAPLSVLIPLAALAIVLTREATKAPLPVEMLIGIDTIAMPSGLLYGAIAGAATFPTMLVAGACSIACLLIARGMVVRLENHVEKSERCKIVWYVVLSASVVLMLVASLVAPATVPMVYPALASCGFAGSAIILSSIKGLGTRSQAIKRMLVSFALFCAVLAIFAGIV
jgi:hypothetical protein